MIIYVGLIGILALIGSEFRLLSGGGIFSQYLSKKNSNAVRGIFILLIFASHFDSYAGASVNQLDIVYTRFAIALGQGVVTYMLFCSGYGVMLSADKKGESYMRAFPRKRILTTLLIYDCAQILFIFFRWLRGNSYSAKDFVLSMLAWESFGIDNWYIFVILSLYIISWMVLRKHKADGPAVTMVTVASVALVAFLIPRGWYTTVLCYPLGMWYYLHREKIEQYMEHNVCYFFVTIILFAFYVIAHKFWYYKLVYMLTMLLFVLCIVVITMKFQINNRFLVYCGAHIQGLFLLHRIPIIALGDIPFMRTHRHLWFALSIMVAFILEFLFHKLITYMQKEAKVS